MPAWRFSRSLILVIALVAMAVTARLGLWQLDRAQQKLARQTELDQRANLPSLGAADLPPAASPLPPELLQRRVRLQGRWLNERAIWLDNRVMVGRTGFFLLTPLALDGGGTVLVQRGWWPRDLTDRSRVPPLPNSSPLIALEGHIQAAPSATYQLGAETPGSLVRQNADIAALATEFRLPLRPLVVVQDGEDLTLPVKSEPAVPADSITATPPTPATTPRLLRQWQPPAADVSKHHGYAAQWFALSALTLALYVWFQLIRPRRHAR
ncbi:MAG: hypothetical protein RL722_796 [Pseudomonadota bacterium]